MGLPFTLRRCRVFGREWIIKLFYGVTSLERLLLGVSWKSSMSEDRLKQSPGRKGCRSLEKNFLVVSKRIPRNPFRTKVIPSRDYWTDICSARDNSFSWRRITQKPATRRTTSNRPSRRRRWIEAPNPSHPRAPRQVTSVAILLLAPHRSESHPNRPSQPSSPLLHRSSSRR